jgi:hypothetical protein
MITRYFPPEASAGSFRPLRFARHLPSHDWQPTVVTLESEFFERYDASLLSKVPGDIEVIRARNRDPWQAIQAKRSRAMRERLTSASLESIAHIRHSQERQFRSSLREIVRTAEAWCYHPDESMGWIRPATKAIKKLCFRKRPDVLWATAGPVSAFHVAQQASRRSGVPYVLDFRDAWTITYNEFEERRPQWAKELDWENMYRLLRGARSVVFRYETEAECYWRAYPNALDVSRIHIIPNGYEGTIKDPPCVYGSQCNIIYTGTLGDYRYDGFLEALTMLKRDRPDDARQLKFHFVGEGSPSFDRELEARGLRDLVADHGPVSQETISQLYRQSDALLILGRPSTMRGYELFAAAKLFGYLSEGRPIIGLLPNDETRRILSHLGVGTVAEIDSVVDIVALLRGVLHTWRERRLETLLPDPVACHEYSAERQVARLVRALEDMPALQPFVPGQVGVPSSLRKQVDAIRMTLQPIANILSDTTFSGAVSRDQ